MDEQFEEGHMVHGHVYVALRHLTPEYLGDSATQRDLDRYKAAVREYQRRTDLAEDVAAAYVWNDGDFGKRVDALIGPDEGE